MAEPTVTISIVNWNQRDLLRQCLRSIREHAGGVSQEVIVVDNASTDGSREMIREEFPEVRLIENAENLGYGRAHNQAMRRASGRFIFLLNNDVLLLPGTLPRLVSFLEQHPDAGAAGCRFYTDPGRLATQPSAFRRYPTPWNDLLDRGLGGRLRQWFPGSRLTGIVTERFARACPENGGGPRRVAHVVGAAIMARRDVVEQGLLFDEAFDFFFEETDWCRRLRARGWQIYYVPEAEIVHLYGRSFAQRSDREQVHYRSYLRYLRKHEGPLTVGMARALHGMTRVSWWKVLGGLVLAYSLAHFLIAGLINPIRTSGDGGDFRAAFHASYRFNPALGLFWRYGPVLHGLMAPLAWLKTDQQIGLVMLGVNYVFLAAAVWLLCQVVLRPPLRWGEWAALAAVWLNFFPLYEAIGERNIEIFELFLLAAALGALSRGRERLAGAAIGVATMTKFLPFLFVPYFWLTGRKKAFWSSLGTIAVIGWMTHFTIGFQHSDTLSYLQSYDYNPAFWNNQALSGVIARLQIGPAPRWLASVLGGAMLAAIGWFFHRTRGRGDTALECSMLAIAMVLVPLHARTHYLLFLLPGLTVGLAHVWRGVPQVPKWWTAGLVTAFLLSGLVVPLSLIDRLVGQPGFSFARELQQLSIPAMGALLLLGLLAHRYQRSGAIAHVRQPS
jgi:GT2 family glycosyltransferase